MMDMDKILEPTQQEPSPKVSPMLRTQLEIITKLADSEGVEVMDVVRAARQCGRRSLPWHQTPAARVLRRLTRHQRLAVNAVAGTRPMSKDKYGFMSPVYPLRGGDLEAGKYAAPLKKRGSK